MYKINYFVRESIVVVLNFLLQKQKTKTKTKKTLLYHLAAQPKSPVAVLAVKNETKKTAEVRWRVLVDVAKFRFFFFC